MGFSSSSALSLLLLLACATAIQIPLQQGQFRCMLIYSIGQDETIKIDINFPQIFTSMGDHNSYYYYLTLRNTKNRELQQEKVPSGHFRRQIHVHEKVIYEVCFELLSNRQITEEVLVDYHAETHYLTNSKPIRIPENLLKVEHMSEIYTSALEIKKVADSYIQIQQARTEKEIEQFEQSEKVEGNISLLSGLQLVAMLGLGAFQLVSLSRKFEEERYKIGI